MNPFPLIADMSDLERKKERKALKKKLLRLKSENGAGANNSYEISTLETFLKASKPSSTHSDAGASKLSQSSTSAPARLSDAPSKTDPPIPPPPEPPTPSLSSSRSASELVSSPAPAAPAVGPSPTAVSTPIPAPSAAVQQPMGSAASGHASAPTAPSTLIAPATPASGPETCLTGTGMTAPLNLATSVRSESDQPQYYLTVAEELRQKYIALDVSEEELKTFNVDLANYQRAVESGIFDQSHVITNMRNSYNSFIQRTRKNDFSNARDPFSELGKGISVRDIQGTDGKKMVDVRIKLDDNNYFGLSYIPLNQTKTSSAKEVNNFVSQANFPGWTLQHMRETQNEQTLVPDNRGGTRKLFGISGGIKTLPDFHLSVRYMQWTRRERKIPKNVGDLSAWSKNIHGQIRLADYFEPELINDGLFFGDSRYCLYRDRYTFTTNSRQDPSRCHFITLSKYKTDADGGNPPVNNSRGGNQKSNAKKNSFGHEMSVFALDKLKTALDISMETNNMKPLPMSAIRLQKLKECMTRDGTADTTIFKRSLTDSVLAENIRGDMLLTYYENLCKKWEKDHPGQPLNDSVCQALDREAQLYIGFRMVNGGEAKRTALAAIQEELADFADDNAEEKKGGEEETRRITRFLKKPKNKRRGMVVSDDDDDGSISSVSSRSALSAVSSSDEDDKE